LHVGSPPDPVVRGSAIDPAFVAQSAAVGRTVRRWASWPCSPARFYLIGDRLKSRLPDLVDGSNALELDRSHERRHKQRENNPEASWRKTPQRTSVVEDAFARLQDDKAPHRRAHRVRNSHEVCGCAAGRGLLALHSHARQPRCLRQDMGEGRRAGGLMEDHLGATSILASIAYENCVFERHPQRGLPVLGGELHPTLEPNRSPMG